MLQNAMLQNAMLQNAMLQNASWGPTSLMHHTFV